MLFISAGHHSKHPIRQDPGAISQKGVKEGDLTIEFRDLVSHELTLLGAKHVKDLDNEVLQQYVNRIQTGSSSVVVEFHFDAGPPTATGSTSLTEVDADRLDKAFAKELVDTTSSILGIKNRGVKTEADTRHGRLALMKEDGLVCLLELAFISNEDDLAKYNSRKKELARAIAQILIKYENIIP